MRFLVGLGLGTLLGAFLGVWLGVVIGLRIIYNQDEGCA